MEVLHLDGRSLSTRRLGALGGKSHNFRVMENIGVAQIPPQGSKSETSISDTFIAEAQRIRNIAGIGRKVVWRRLVGVSLITTLRVVITASDTEKGSPRWPHTDPMFPVCKLRAAFPGDRGAEG